MLNIVVALLVFLMPVLIIGSLMRYEKWRHKKRFEHPLSGSKSMRRPPGAYLGRKLVTQTFDLFV